MPPRDRRCSCGPPRVGLPRGRPSRGPSRPRGPPGSPGGGGAAGSGRGPSRRGGRARRRPAADHLPGRQPGGPRGHRRDGSGRPRTRRRSHGRGCARSGREAGATPRATGLEHRAATPGAHAGTEPVLLLALPVVGLERPLHAGSLTRGGPPSSANCGGAVPGAETRSHPRGRDGHGATWLRACGRTSTPRAAALGTTRESQSPCGSAELSTVGEPWGPLLRSPSPPGASASSGGSSPTGSARCRPRGRVVRRGASTRCGWVPWIGLEWG